MTTTPLDRRRHPKRGIVAAALVALSWIVYGLAYALNIGSLSDPTCEVYCGASNLFANVFTATFLLYFLPVMIVIAFLGIVITGWGSRIDKLIGAASLLALAPFAVLAWLFTN